MERLSFTKAVFSSGWIVRFQLPSADAFVFDVKSRFAGRQNIPRYIKRVSRRYLLRTLPCLPVLAVPPGAGTFQIGRPRNLTKPGGFMSKRLSRHRLTAFQRQNGRCFYCECPMWIENAKAFARQHLLTLKQAKQLACTAEHLKAVQDGGADTADNIVAACRFCNDHRHRRKVAPSPELHQMRVKTRVAHRRWHTLSSHFGAPVSDRAALSVAGPKYLPRT